MRKSRKQVPVPVAAPVTPLDHALAIARRMGMSSMLRPGDIVTAREVRVVSSNQPIMLRSYVQWLTGQYGKPTAYWVYPAPDEKLVQNEQLSLTRCRVLWSVRGHGAVTLTHHTKRGHASLFVLSFENNPKQG